ncbi:MAG: hypothetical protein COV31_00510 [Candidatus Yanofskybacteria bacterium CG10_big_fil_rev_8_21_14_0_10_46_23]|uniref:GGDEF domain-containing protein n=1 Tax=Candidatus Yanofskybacteria bacterium CG10_big_fil_rev_8_21_14_0_10_46_23 TaxID=1975098 RepID=A0A2H0R4Y8_9BACT|nr:MAG: hypothetical protein COV31_00510 [Candidatus Yanofskybacteria bacterium CG10_big_fil_rev_8_21_14_0_10_46_23]
MDREKELEQKIKDLERLSFVDGLTQVLNRRGLEIVGDKVLAGSIRRQRNLDEAGRVHLAVLFLDLDNFKSINDTYGHEAGDRVLEEAAKRLEANVRQSDLVGRWGGEEFIILLPDTDQVGLKIVGEKVRRGLEIAPVVFASQAISVTASIGGAVIVGDEELAQGIKRADEAMYYAKTKLGKNAVAISGQTG